MLIEVIFDTICPWCYIGSRRLRRALSSRLGLDARIKWRSFILNPEIPQDGISRAAYLERKFGGPARVARILSGQADAGAEEGIYFNFPAIHVAPNSMNSHKLVALANQYGIASEMLGILFRAYFENGLDIGSKDVLYTLATDFGLSPMDVLHALEDEVMLDAVMAENAATHRMNITGVPCFIFNNAYAISGAQEPEILARMLDIAAEGSSIEPMTLPAQQKPGAGSLLLSRPS